MEFETLFQPPPPSPHLLLPPVRIRRQSPQPPRWLPDRFTPMELDAAELLMQLSSGSSGRFSGAGEEMSRSPKPSSANSSPRSVNTRPPPPEDVLLEAEDDEEAMGPRRKVKRYRAIADVYASTEPVVGDGSVAKKAQKRKREVA